MSSVVSLIKMAEAGMVYMVWYVRGLWERKGLALKQLFKQRDGALAWKAVQPALVPQLGALRPSGSLLLQGLCY